MLEIARAQERLLLIHSFPLQQVLLFNPTGSLYANFFLLELENGLGIEDFTIRNLHRILYYQPQTEADAT